MWRIWRTSGGYQGLGHDAHGVGAAGEAPEAMSRSAPTIVRPIRSIALPLAPLLGVRRTGDSLVASRRNAVRSAHRLRAGDLPWLAAWHSAAGDGLRLRHASGQDDNRRHAREHPFRHDGFTPIAECGVCERRGEGRNHSDSCALAGPIRAIARQRCAPRYPQIPPARHRLPWMHVVEPHTHAVPTQDPGLPASHDALPLHAHAPAVHLNPGGHGRPHAPQLAASVCRSLHPAGVV